MRSISTKITLALVAVGLTGTFLVAVFARWSTSNAFQEFLFNQDRSDLVSGLVEHYQTHGSWNELHQAFPSPFFTKGDRDIRRGSPFALADQNGNILVPGLGYSPGSAVPGFVLEEGLPVQSEGETVGFLLFGQSNFRVGPAGTEFLQRVSLLFLATTLGAGVIALLLSGLLSRSLTRPILELTAATREVAKGNLEKRVAIHSNDEIGQLAESFNQMNAQLARAQELRRQMTADIAHELRTPLSVIMGHADAVQDEVLPPSKETFQVIQEEAQRLNHLVEDLRTLTLSEAGEMPLNLQDLPLTEVLERAVAGYRSYALTQGIDLTIDLADDLPIVPHDPQRMEQVMGNLLSNAIRYTPAGGKVAIRAEASEQEMIIRVSDTGPGIPEEDLEKVFHRFYRVDAARSREDGGSGLGLAIAKSIIERHGGSIRVESVEGEGSTFVICLSSKSDRTGARDMPDAQIDGGLH